MTAGTSIAAPTELSCNVLLVCPRFHGRSFWDNSAACEVFGAGIPAPPLGLITVAAMLPAAWECRLVNRSTEELSAAAEGQEIELVGRGRASAGAGTSATADVAPALAESRVLLVITTAAKIKMFTDILITDGVAVSCATIDRAESAAERLRPSVVILEDLDAVDIIASGKRLRDSGDGETPVVLVTSRDDDRMLAEGGFVDRLLEPFKPSYARARVLAAIMRRASRWQ